MKSFLFRIISILILFGAAMFVCILISAISVYFFGVRWTAAFNRSTFVVSILTLAGFLAEAILKNIHPKTKTGKAKSRVSLVEELARVISSFF